jgi:TatD DNase family protein
MYIDSHAHLSDPPLLEEIDAVLQRARDAGLSHIVNICTGLSSLREGLLLQERAPWVLQTAAITPHDAGKEAEGFFSAIEAAAKKGLLTAIGETGLDAHYLHASMEQQRESLQRHLDLAALYQLPVVFHCREAFPDLFAATDTHAKNLRAVLHCFTGTWEEAKEGLDRGWLISISGIVTFKKSESLRDVVRRLPLSGLVVETDAPYLAPQSKRGKTNEPSFLPETVACVAELLGKSVEEVAAATTENAMGLFKLTHQRDSK